MVRLCVWLQTLGSDEEGQTLVEYALIIALVSIALITALTALSGKIGGVFTEIGTKLDAAIP